MNLFRVYCFVSFIYVSSSCNSVGERTYALSKYGPAKWGKPTKKSDGIQTQTLYLKGKPFQVQYLRNSTVFKEIDYRLDGSIHGISYIDGTKVRWERFDKLNRLERTIYLSAGIIKRVDEIQ